MTVHISHSYDDAGNLNPTKTKAGNRILPMSDFVYDALKKRMAAQIAFLTLAAEKGVHPSVMQKLAGHSTARITMEIYTHANMKDKRAAMESLQEVFA